MKTLVKKDDIDVNAKDNENFTALIKATMKNNIEAMKLLIEYSRSGHDSHIDDLVWRKDINSRMCDVNAIDAQGATASIWAAVHGNNEAIWKLLITIDIQR